MGGKHAALESRNKSQARHDRAAQLDVSLKYGQFPDRAFDFSELLRQVELCLHFDFEHWCH
jgi:hypothetical protein